MEHAMNAGSRGHHRVLLATCTECGISSDPSWRGWRAYRSDDPELDEPPALAFYCRSCAQREFFPES